VKRVIFTLYKDLNSNDNIKQYFNRLLKNKKEYAKSIGVDFKFYQSARANNFVDINLYKHHLMRKLADSYDEILYVDFDVIFNTEKNFFEKWDLYKGIVIKDQNDQIKSKNIDDDSEIYFWGEKNSGRSPTLKYLITYELLNKKVNNVINTGIIGACSKHIKELKFLKRLPSIKKRIEELKDSNHQIRRHYYPNNEAIFSYILEEYDIPYQLMDNDWHDIRSGSIVERPLGKIIHFINKIFDTYYKEKSKIVFSLYIDIPKNKLDNPGKYDWDKELNKSEITKIQFKKYWDKLLNNKKEYAKNIRADWKLFGNDKHYKEFAKRFPNISEYNIVNFYKIYLLDELSKKYDNVLYLDFDVVANKNIDFFEYNDVGRYICCQIQHVKDEIHINSKLYNRSYRAPISKYWNCHALLTEHDIDYELVHAFNTGIIGVSKETMKQLKYFDDIEDTIQLMTKVKDDEDSIYPPKIRAKFGYDNETVFGYKIRLHNLKFKDLEFDWHYRIDRQADINFMHFTEVGIKHSYQDAVLMHFINKRFDWFFNGN
tara:strand:+ start:264 stop:1889 length:1626 start_codon:yes stop_codon:yes gene_type:complete